MDALVVVADGFEDSEFFYPYYRLIEEGFSVDVATPGGESVEGKHGYSREADLAVSEAEESDYDLLMVPGGKSPEHLRLDAPDSVDLVENFDAAGKPVAAICHGAQLMMSADVLEGRAATCYWSIRDDLENAGAEFVDEAAVVDEGLVTSRHPDDLPAFMIATFESVGGS